MAMDTSEKSGGEGKFTGNDPPKAFVRMPFGNFPANTAAVPLVFFAPVFKEN
jgi:hypothetical protein